MEITTEDFSGHRFYSSILPIDNNSFMTKLEDTYVQLKEFHVANGKYTEQDITNNIIYDPSNYLDDHNIFIFPVEELHFILSNIKKLFLVACEENNIDVEKQKYYIHGWMNYFPAKMHQDREYEELFWHDHGQKPNEFHGYYAVNAEPSVTHYRANEERLDRENKNGRLILAKTGLEHAVGKWNFDTPRISIAYNIMPLDNVLHSKLSGDIIPFVPIV